jgi:putative intracellular protease/amidase
VGLTEVVPFLLESRLTELGGRYEHAAKWQPFAVRDGQLVTGQNPASSGVAARETLAAIAARRPAA